MLFDIIIPCSKRDAGFLPRVVEYIRKNISEAGVIYVITARALFDNVRKHLGDDVVTLVDENEMIENFTFSRVKELLTKKKWYVRQGWYFQQLLKMGFSQTDMAGEYYLSWDADTLPLSKLSFMDNGHPLFTVKKEYHPAYFETMEKLFVGGCKKFSYSFICEHMLFKSSVMRELISEIAQNDRIEGSDWMEKIINACEFSQTDIYKEPYFSEFETYGTYAMLRYPELYHTRQLNTFRGAGYIRGRSISDKMLEELSLDLDIASFEYGATPPFPYNINSWIHLNVLPKLEKTRNMPIKELPQHFRGILRKRLGI